ncbi:INO80 complex subunit B High mobility group AT-hook 1-like 4 PAP-1-associated protein 1 [Triplophysa tibetana]|uniref:INO80 complex subunit B High mobility group AT-hook 1-like 4 PAP-1-associated protein 1 n=1 Tax=Triplophysa tibetana TaxID=1572043 RepID=A0A5A9PMD0_9TELE|nr:INO80 complex subunit B High mobility group AT-hook 1-like 4 PAP-1-associated protein 1 [Triplophysa tibetana]
MIHPRFLAGNEDDYINKKKHKKHKKHKKKHHRDDGQSFSSEALESDSGMVLKPPQLKLKIKLGGQTLGTKSVPTFTVIPDSLRVASPLNVDSDDGEDDEDSDDDVPSEGVPIEQYRAWLDEDSNLDPSPLQHMDTYSLLEVPMDEEERWLDALEKGELDDNGELKRDIDESLLTARQKALLHKHQSQPLLELPMGYKEKELTAEMMQKREERARKRRLQAAKKAEESKNQTIERLTKTSKAKIKSMKERKSKLGQLPMVRYSSSSQGASVSYPAGIPHPSPASTQAPPPMPVNCGVSGCANVKKYSCSKTGTPLCSMECYKKNLTLVEGVA